MTDSTYTSALVAVLVGYLVGSIPVAFLIGRAVSGVDVRHAGEGNVGARNVFHVIGSRWGIVTFLGDFAKGAAVALLFRGQPDWQLVVAATAMLVGHGYPVWLGFLGGKGLSPAGGVTAVLMPWAVLIGGAAAGVTWTFTRRFLPTLVVAIVTTIVVAPLTGVPFSMVALVVWLFALTGVKRAADESRMREVEAATGWDRNRGGLTS